MIDTEKYRIILENLNIASVVVNYTISFFLGYYFLQFFSDKKRTALMGTVVYHAVLTTGGVIPYDLGIVARYLFIISSILGCFLAMYAVERIRIHQKVVLALVWYTMRGLAVFISSEIEAPISNLVFSNPNLNRIEWLIYEYVGVLALEHGIFLLYSLLLIKLYHKGYGDPDY